MSPDKLKMKIAEVQRAAKRFAEVGDDAPVDELYAAADELWRWARSVCRACIVGEGGELLVARRLVLARKMAQLSEVQYDDTHDIVRELAGESHGARRGG